MRIYTTKKINNMRIQDFDSYSVQKKKKFTSEYTFTSELNYVDVKLTNRPPELTNVDDLKCEVEYEISVERKKDGVQDIAFKINQIELELIVDDHPEDPKEFEFEIVPGENIDNNLVKIRKGESLIPTNPTLLEINMGKSTKVADFRVSILFGKNE